MSRVRQRALVTGAASGIGHLAVQIAKSRGAKHLLLAEIRADQTVDSSQQEFDDVESAVDVVLDLPAPRPRWASCHPARRWLAIAVTSGCGPCQPGGRRPRQLHAH